MLRAPARIALAAVATLLLAVACWPRAKAPALSSSTSLSPAGSASSAPPRSPTLAVLHGAPRGATDGTAEITLLFDRPVRALELAGAEAPSPARLVPEVPGRWAWVGTQALTFSPASHLPRGTSFEVVVPAGTRAMDGTALAETFRMTFTTPGPALARVEPAPGARNVDLGARVTLRFDQPIDAAELARAITMGAVVAADQAPRPVAFDVTRPDSANLGLAVLVPRAKLPRDATIRVTLDASLRGAEGPLPAGAARTVEFQTYGAPGLADVTCGSERPKGRCEATGGVEVALATPLKLGDVRRALAVAPRVPLEVGGGDEGELVDRVWVRGRFRPAATYRFTLRARPAGAPVRDAFGQVLARDATRVLVMDDARPEGVIGVRGDTLEAGLRAAIPVAVVNAPDAELAVAPLAPEDLAAVLRAPEEALVARVRGHAGARVSRPFAGPKNATVRREVRVADVLGARGRGAIGVALTVPGARDERPSVETAVVQVTDLALTAKISRAGSLVWVTRLSTGAPVDGATVEILDGDRRIGPFRTGADGLAEVPASAFLPASAVSTRALIVARAGDEWAAHGALDYVGTWSLGAGSTLEVDDGPIGLLFTDRGIYRPGDEVKVAGIVRLPAARGTTTPAGRAVKLSLRGATGDELARADAPLTAFGTVSTTLKLPRAASLGTAHVEARLAPGANGADAGDGDAHDDSRAADLTADLEVAEYQPAELAVDVAPASASWIRGDTARFAASGRFLYGAPASGLDARVRVTRAATTYRPPGLDAAFVADADAWWSGKSDLSPNAAALRDAAAKLDARGEVQVETPLALPGARGPESVTCELEVSDVSRRTVAGRASRIVHPGEVYLAIDRGKSLLVKTNEAIPARVLAVEPGGAPRAGVRAHVDLVRRTWTTARVDAGGEIHTESAPSDAVVASCDVTTAKAPVACALAPTAPGFHLLHATTTDARGNVVEAATVVYVTGSGEASWAERDARAVELVPDTTSYRVGDTAHVLVKSPWPRAEALITVERDGVLSRERRVIEGSATTLDVLITEDFRPNAFVSVVLVRGRTKAPAADARKADVGQPAFRAGYASLVVDPAARRLEVAVRPARRESAPGTDLDVEVEVTSGGAPAHAEVTLYAVDEGALALTGYRTPDPLAALSAPRALHVLLVDSRSELAAITGPKGGAELGVDKGLDGGGGGAVRRDFRQTAWFESGVTTDAKGKARRSFRLPDTLTTYRIMAVAVAEDDHAGSGEASTVVKKPLLLRPAVPRALRAGDDVELGVVVAADAAAQGRATVQLVATGVTLDGPTSRDVDLAGGRAVEVRFRARAERVGTAKLSWKAKLGDATDAVEIERPIASPAVIETVAVSGDTRDAVAIPFGDLGAMRDDVGGLDVSLASTALVGLDGGFDQLLSYPHGCAEQLASKLVPLVALRDLARDLGIALPGNPDDVAAATVAKLLAAQRFDGAFGYWPDSPRADAWVTAWAVMGLAEASRRGIDVPSRALDEGKAAIRRAIEHRGDDAYGAATAALLLDVLARVGAPDAGWAARVLERRTELPMFARAALLDAIATGGGDRAAADALVTDLEATIRLDGPVARVVTNEHDAWAPLLDSDVRTSAMALRALVAARPSHPLAARLAAGLLVDRTAGTWRTTQDTAWALLALDAYRAAAERDAGPFDARALLGDCEIARAHAGDARAVGATGHVDARDVRAGGLSFDADAGHLFYGARLRYARRDLPRDAIERGLSVIRAAQRVRPDAVAAALAAPVLADEARFTAGDLVLGEVLVATASPRRQLAIEAPIPAGFEAIDARLATTSAALDVDARAPDEPSDDDVARGAATHTPWSRRETRDDRVVFFVDELPAGVFRFRWLARAASIGTFIVPPARAEEMYAPDTFGRTAASVVTVAP